MGKFKITAFTQNATEQKEIIQEGSENPSLKNMS